MSDVALEKARIINLEAADAQPIQCMFNPKEYSFAKQNNYTRATAKGDNVPPVEFGGGGAATLQLQLLFDTYGSAKNGRAEDVRKAYTNRILELMMVDKNLKDQKTHKSRPPRVRFQWGSSWSFNAVIKSVTQKFTLFLGDGTPVRATLDVAFEQVEDNFQYLNENRTYPRQNPTSGGESGGRLWTVKEGDTLAWIAYKEYGDATRWRPIAAYNRLAQVRTLRPGTVLEIPHA